MGSRNQTHCYSGHEFTVENTYLDRGRRRCRACTQERNKLWEVYKRTSSKKGRPAPGLSAAPARPGSA